MVELGARDGVLGRTIHFLVDEDGEDVLQVYIQGVSGPNGPEVVNSIPTTATKTDLLRAWKRKIAREVRAEVGRALELENAALSVSFFFCPSTHRNHAMDTDNFLKPVIDGVALGLFEADLDAALAAPKTRFSADSSVFRHFYVERHDTADPNEEGAMVTVWTVA